MSTEERSLFLLLGYAANQTILLSKLVIFSCNETATGVELNLSLSQSQILLRLSVGVLNEAWELIHKRFLSKPLGKEYRSLLDEVGTVSLKNLMNHFGGSSIINRIRTNYAFHHPYDSDVDAAFESAANDQAWDNDWNWYFSTSGNNFYYFISDFVIQHGIMNSIGETNLDTAQKKLMAEVQQVFIDMNLFIMALTRAFWTKHFGTEMPGDVCAQISDAPDLLDVRIPVFVEFPESPEI
jgi:hypothetical protein